MLLERVHLNRMCSSVANDLLATQAQFKLKANGMLRCYDENVSIEHISIFLKLRHSMQFCLKSWCKTACRVWYVAYYPSHNIIVHAGIFGSVPFLDGFPISSPPKSPLTSETRAPCPRLQTSLHLRAMPVSKLTEKQRKHQEFISSRRKFLGHFCNCKCYHSHIVIEDHLKPVSH